MSISSIPRNFVVVSDQEPASPFEGQIWIDESTQSKDTKQYKDGNWNNLGLSFGSVVPIGGIMPYHEYSETEIGSRYVKCNGQTIDDPDSPLDGQKAPDLNNNNRFLRGNTSTGGKGGAEQVAISENELASHYHDLDVWEDNSSDDAIPGDMANKGYRGSETPSQNAGGDSAHENRPPFFDVTYIMRVK